MQSLVLGSPSQSKLTDMQNIALNWKKIWSNQIFHLEKILKVTTPTSFIHYKNLSKF